MADNTFELSAVISANIEQYKDAMSDLIAATQEASQALRSQLAGSSEEAGEAVENLHAKSAEASEGIKESFDSIRETATHLLETFAVFEGINILREQISQALEFGENMQRLSVETGATTTFLQELGFAATVTGSNVQELTMAAGQLTRAYAQIQAGGGSPQLLAALKNSGINPSQLASMQTGIMAVSEAVQHLGASSAQARDLVLQLFGRQGLQYLPMLANFQELSAEANKLGVVLGGQLIGQLDQAKESLNTLGAVVDADKERFVAALSPAIEGAAKMLTDLGAKIGTLEQGQGMTAFSRTVVNGMFNVADAIVTAEGKLLDFVSDFETAVTKIENVGHDLAAPFEWLAKTVSGAATQIKSMATTGQFDYGAAGSHGFGAEPQASGASKEIQDQLDVLRDLREQMLENVSNAGGAPKVTSPGGGTGADAGIAATQSAGAAKKALDDNLRSYQQQLQAYTEEQAIEVSVATNTAQAKVQAATNVYEKAVSLIGQTGAVSAAGYQKEVDAALRAGVEELNARREMLNQTKALAAEQINAAAAEQLQQLAVAKAALAEELAAHQITKAQELAAEQNLASQTLAIELNKDGQLESLWAGDAQKFQEFEQQKVDAAQKAQQQILEIQTQSLAQQEQQTQQAGTKMAADINQGLTLMTKYFETAGKQQQNVMREAFQEIVKDFQAKLAQMVAQWLESTALFQTFTGGEALGQGPHGTAGPGGGIIGGIGSVLSGTVGGPNGAGYSLTGGAIGGNPGLAGLGPSSFAPGQGLTADMFTQPLSQAFHSITGELSSVFGQAFSGASGSISSVFSTIFGGLGSLFGGGGSGGFSLTSLMSFLPMLGFEQGGIVPSAAGGMVVPGGSGGTFAMLHPREMVLPAKYSEGVQRMIDRGNGDGGPTNHIEIHSNGHNYSALDSDGMSEILDKHAGAISDAVMNHLGNHGGREQYR